MNNQSQFTLQIFEKIGSPLFSAVNEVSSRMVMTGQSPAAPTDEEYAETIAKLLTSLTKTSSEAIETLDLDSKDPESDDLHVSMASVLSPVIANLYQIMGLPPTDEDIAKISKALNTLSTFSNNFSVTNEAGEALSNLKTADQSNEHLKNLMGCVPLINAVTAFSFGETPEKLIKNLYKRLEDDAKALSDDYQVGTYADVLPCVVTLYSQCHFSEMARIMSMSDKDRETQAIGVETVISKYDAHLDMLKTLASSMMGVPVAQTQSSATETTPPPAPQKETETPTQAAPPAANETQGSDNPMSFFSAKKDESAAE